MQTFKPKTSMAMQEEHWQAIHARTRKVVSPALSQEEGLTPPRVYRGRIRFDISRWWLALHVCLHEGSWQCKPGAGCGLCAVAASVRWPSRCQQSKIHTREI